MSITVKRQTKKRLLRRKKLTKGKRMIRKQGGTSMNMGIDSITLKTPQDVAHALLTDGISHPVPDKNYIEQLESFGKGSRSILANFASYVPKRYEIPRGFDHELLANAVCEELTQSKESISLEEIFRIRNSVEYKRIIKANESKPFNTFLERALNKKLKPTQSMKRSANTELVERPKGGPKSTDLSTRSYLKMGTEVYKDGEKIGTIEKDNMVVGIGREVSIIPEGKSKGKPKGKMTRITTDMTFMLNGQYFKI